MHIETETPAHTQEQQTVLQYRPFTLPTHRQACVRRTLPTPHPSAHSAPSSYLERFMQEWAYEEEERKQQVLHVQDVLDNPALLALLSAQEQQELWQASVLLSAASSMPPTAVEATPLPPFVEATAEAHHVLPLRSPLFDSSMSIPPAPPIAHEWGQWQGKAVTPLLWLGVLLGAGTVVFLYLFVPALATLIPFFSTLWGRVMMAFELLGLGEFLVCRILMNTTKR